MSSRLRAKIERELLEKEFVSVEVKSQCLSTVIYECVTKTHQFMGAVLQSLTINYSHQLPTAGILFNTDAKHWEMLINPYFFCKKLNAEQRKAVLLHELSHILHKHPLRVPFLKIAPRKRILMNIAADMAINQFIKNLPDGCPQCTPYNPDQPNMCPNEMCPGRGIFLRDFYDRDEKTQAKVPWKPNQTMEHYYEKLLTRFEDPEDGEGDGGQDGNAGGGADTGDLPNTIDEHLWDNGAVEEKDMLDATEELAKRAMVKARLEYDQLPGSVKELLEDIKQRRAELNYKQLIMSAMKRHASGHDRDHTWTRPSKRYGNKARGTKVGQLPKLHNFIDTSGSISIEEANGFLDVVDQFLRVGSRKCDLGFFHTALYKDDKYKMGTKIAREDIQSGGTDLTPVMQRILEQKPDLSVILTDGCYGDVNCEQWMKPGEKFPQVLFIISKDGTTEHPLKRFGETIKIPDTATFNKK
jgi:predicted metal-dependent peptidase